MVNISSAMAAEFIEKTTLMHERLVSIGSSPFKNED
jgi:hypothetical protein